LALGQGMDRAPGVANSFNRQCVAPVV